ncbi:hypothetical protein G4Z16_13900 [Streptomyces bathyalis]|uniref:Uncharacterized protein n=2 Tax=Streptomyces bathyalis TaxID=2710756 RepID=A0A7T1WS72_9ACTN|nr:hypothetical protein G4Z16_13900 [Streptomyces bathyalis]
MPSTTELPPRHPRREFVEELFSYYRDAGRPTLRNIAEEIADSSEFDAFTASRETIRKTLRGETVPLTFDVVNAVMTVLCKRAGIDPDTERWTGGFGDDSTTHRQNLRNLWNNALDTPLPPPASTGGWWGSGGYSDEPPF